MKCRFNPPPVLGPGETPTAPRMPSMRRRCFNPPPVLGPGETHGTQSDGAALSFQSAPGPRAGGSLVEAAFVRGCVAFQSAPGPRAGGNFRLQADRVQGL